MLKSETQILGPKMLLKIIKTGIFENSDLNALRLRHLVSTNLKTTLSESSKI